MGPFRLKKTSSESFSRVSAVAAEMSPYVLMAGGVYVFMALVAAGGPIVGKRTCPGERTAERPTAATAIDFQPGALGRNRTCGLLFRRESLYPTELRGPIRSMNCSRCGEDKPATDFYYRRTEARHHAYCRACHNAYTQERFKRRKLRAIEHLGGRCSDCGGAFHPSVFEFHHRDPGSKDLTGNQIKRGAWARVVRELDKCDLLCANCHRLRHWQHDRLDGDSPGAPGGSGGAA